MKTAGDFRDDAATRLLSGDSNGAVVQKVPLGPYAVSQIALDAANFFIADVSHTLSFFGVTTHEESVGKGGARVGIELVLFRRHFDSTVRGRLACCSAPAVE